MCVKPHVSAFNTSTIAGLVIFLTVAICIMEKFFLQPKNISIFPEIVFIQI